MKILLALTAFCSISACTATPQMVENQKAKCTQIGYTPGSPDHLTCVERGVQMGEAGMTGAASSSVSSAVAVGLAGALF